MIVGGQIKRIFLRGLPINRKKLDPYLSFEFLQREIRILGSLVVHMSFLKNVIVSSRVKLRCVVDVLESIKNIIKRGHFF